MEARGQKADTKLNKFLAEKVPSGLQATLDGAFAKAFWLIFQKGMGAIEKTYSKEKIVQQHKIDNYIEELRRNRKSLKAFSKRAKGAGAQHVIMSGVAGTGMGIVGVGIPDIPVFTAMLLRSVYEISLVYGYDYQKPEEQLFILQLIQGGVAYGEELKHIDDSINMQIRTETIGVGLDLETAVKETAGFISKELMYLKFLQGIPIAGAVGGFYDAIYMRNITKYAELKYRRRFYYERKRNVWQKIKKSSV